MKVRISAIRFGANYRQDLGDLETLAENMRENGQHTPIVVREMKTGFQLLAGERRTRAAQLLGWDELEANVVDCDDATALGITLSENMARKATNPIEDASAFARLRDMNWDTARIARAAGVSEKIVSSRLALLSLRDDLQDLVRSGQLSIGYACALAEMNLDANRQLLAMAKLRANAAPTLAWFRGILSVLLEQQASESMFDLSLLTVTCAADLGSIQRDELPPLPSNTRPPAPPRPKNARGVPRKTALQSFVTFWENARDCWDELGKPAQVAECQGAIAGLREAALWL